MTVRPVAEIRVGERHRKDLGDIAGLAAAIASEGLLHPIVIRPDGTLIAGERRLRAFLHLKRETIPVTVLDTVSIVRGEYSENVNRKGFSPSEMVAIAKDFEVIERAEAKKRQGERTDLHPANLPTGSYGRAGDRLAKAGGGARRTLEKSDCRRRGRRS